MKSQGVIQMDKKYYKQEVDRYIRNNPSRLMTSRFTNTTKNENDMYKQSKKINGSLYCTPEPISCSVPFDTNVLVLEMNNDTNKIMAIGKVKNKPITGTINVYENRNYNRFIYAGQHHIKREDMNEEEDKIMRVFDVLCFTGNKHMKRGQGLKSFPGEMLYRMSSRIDIIDFITKMFERRTMINTTTRIV
jgi:hypothetical protein